MQLFYLQRNIVSIFTASFLRHFRIMQEIYLLMSRPINRQCPSLLYIFKMNLVMKEVTPLRETFYMRHVFFPTGYLEINDLCNVLLCFCICHQSADTDLSLWSETQMAVI